MMRISPGFLGLAVLGAYFLAATSAQADDRHIWTVASPNHEQTFAYGSETNRIWADRNGRLVLLLDFTNDPFVDRDSPRQYDNFTFSFPGVTLGKDGHTYYYHTPDGRSIPVAAKQAVFLGFKEIRLLPNATLIVDKPHGYLSLSLVIRDNLE